MSSKKIKSKTRNVYPSRTKSNVGDANKKIKETRNVYPSRTKSNVGDANVQTNKQNVNVTVQLQNPYTKRRSRSNTTINPKPVSTPAPTIIYRNIYQPPLLDNKPVVNSAYIDTKVPKITTSNVLGQEVQVDSQTALLDVDNESINDKNNDNESIFDENSNTVADVFGNERVKPSIFINELMEQANDINDAKNIIQKYTTNILTKANKPHLIKLAKLMGIDIMDKNNKEKTKVKLVRELKESVNVHTPV